MNIAYHGYFLRQGLEKLGHNLLDLPADEIDINTKLENLGQSVDLVLLEMYGNSFPVCGLAACEAETVAWCVDTPINEFWLRDACKLFDHVFVDQRQSAAAMQTHGIRAEWLPLCAQDSYFVEPQEKIHDITFVGTVNRFRTKRANLLNLLGKYAKLNLVSNVSMQEAQSILAQSKITLNENLFDGLTLRVFQGCGAGSLVFGEKGDGSDAIFADGEHIVYFDPENVLDKLDSILAAAERCQEMAIAARELCRGAHTSEARAVALFDSIRHERAKNCRGDWGERLWHESRAMYSFIRRYGGSLSSIIENFETIIANHPAKAAEAMLELGNICARRGIPEQALKYYLNAAGESNMAWAKLALFHAGRDDEAMASFAAKRFLSAAGLEPKGRGIRNIPEILLDISKGYLKIGRNFDLGFNKFAEDQFPDTAFEVARLSWQKRPGPEAMTLMLQALAPYGLEGELLPELKKGIEAGIFTRRQELRTAEIALDYYDQDTANWIISAIKGS